MKTRHDLTAFVKNKEKPKMLSNADSVVKLWDKELNLALVSKCWTSIPFYCCKVCQNMIFGRNIVLFCVTKNISKL